MIPSDKAEKVKREAKPSSKVTYRQYYNVSEYRTKLWYGLKDCADNLESMGNSDLERSELIKTTCTSLSELEEIERY